MTTCCDDHRTALTRRGLLGALGGTALTATFGSVVTETVFASPAAAAEPAGRGTLVVLSLRGGADGLSLVVPHADEAYYRARPVTGIPHSELLVPDATFGLHPSLSALVPMWQAERLAVVHAVGLPAPNRSHFKAIEEVEDAAPGSPERRGWLNRLIGLDPPAPLTRGVHLGGTMLPTSLSGPTPALATTGTAGIALAGPSDPAGVAARERSLRRLWEGESGSLGDAVEQALAAPRAWAPVRDQPTDPGNGATYPSSDLGRALAESARVIRADVGAEVITLDLDGWDMHSGLGTLEWGEMRKLAQQLAEAIAAFFTDLADASERVTLVTVTEFGRRVRENASQGTDHGWGTAMLVAGAGVRGGEYHGRWPGLDGQDDVSGEVPVTTDYRSVLAEVLVSRFGSDISQVFPGFTRERVGVMRGA